MDINCASSIVDELFARTITPLDQLEKESLKRSNDPNQVATLKNYLEKKLYHQYMELCYQYLSNEHLEFQKYDKIEFFVGAILPLRQHFNPLRFATLAGFVIDNNELPVDDNITFLEKLKQDINYEKDNSEVNSTILTQHRNVEPPFEIQADLYHRILKAFELTKRADMSLQCNELLDFVAEKLDKLRGAEPCLIAMYHRSCAAYEKTINRPNMFYKHALLYLSYTPLDEIPQRNKPCLAYEIIVAAIISDNIFNLGELILHPLIQNFSNMVKQVDQQQTDIDEQTLCNIKSFSWILDILVSLHEGDIDMLKFSIEKHKDHVKNSPLCTAEAQICIIKKTTTLALMDLAFKKDKNERILKFEEIADHCRVSITEIELLVMKAINMELINGYIDQTSRTVEINWVHPHILDKGRLQLLGTKIDNWINSTQKLVEQLESLAPEFVIY
ncbi:PCI domain-containing protein [Cryptosporidium andersoni]|uniref:PCI domain-containing protein n=1 Tax=Cryptosporidium andersoni TaxID=117008 RepID=A0A1J4MP57_9CRYT|nr:PCI domain-containing protein [Cryptosporidium andersoni]